MSDWVRSRTDEPFAAAAGLGVRPRAEQVAEIVARKPNPLGIPTELREAIWSIESVTAGDPRDWASYYRDSWLYGIVLGWDCEEDHEHDPDPEDGCLGTMESVAARHGWSEDDVARLRRYRTSWRQVFGEEVSDG